MFRFATHATPPPKGNLTYVNESLTELVEVPLGAEVPSISMRKVWEHALGHFDKLSERLVLSFVHGTYL